MTKKSIIYLWFLFSFIFTGCTDDCGECFSPPSPFVFEIVNAGTGENLFTNGTYTPNDIRVERVTGSPQAGYAFLAENNINLLQINGIGWKTENGMFRVIVAADTLFTLEVQARRLTVDCCSFTQYTKVEIDGINYRFNAATGIYQILVEQ